MHLSLKPSIWIKNQINNFIKKSESHKQLSMVDIACGNGRHVKEFHNIIKITAIDYNKNYTNNLSNLENVNFLNLNLESREFKSNFNQKFDIVLNTNFLYRPLIPKLFDLVYPGGIILFETFGEGNEKFGKPKNPKYLLKNNELRSYLPNYFEELYFFHGIVENPKKAVKQYLSAMNKLKL